MTERLKVSNYPITDLSSFAGQVMHVPDRNLARELAKQDGRILRGTYVWVREFATTRTWRPSEPVLARVTDYEVEEFDDYIDVTVRFVFDKSVFGEFGGSWSGRTYVINKEPT